jgi:hypothetical protein
VTYGETSTGLRGALAALLHQHRIQQRLGGAGSHSIPVTTNAEQRAQLGQQIRRYRHGVLLWCLHGIMAAAPHLDLTATPRRSRGPTEELRYRLSRVLEASATGLPSLDELTTDHRFQTVNMWRDAAQAAALGEHDFAEDLQHGRLSDAERTTVTRDVADIVRAVVVLDRRYAGVPGWEPLRESGRLGRAAETCGAFVGQGAPDDAVDVRGRQRPAMFVDGAPRPGVRGVLQAQHNLLIRLGQFPDALNLRRVLHGQQELSLGVARRAQQTAPDIADQWLGRAATYASLVRASRNLGGRIGTGAPAAAEAAIAAQRLTKLDPGVVPTERELRHLDHLFTHVDARVREIIEHGAANRLYFVSVRLPRVVAGSEHLLKPVRERYVPIEPIHSRLMTIARQQLPAAAPRPTPPAEAARSRQALKAALGHRPEQRDGRLSM